MTSVSSEYTIACLYEDVRRKYSRNVSEDAILKSFKDMTEAYKPDSGDLNVIVNYNDFAHRCAYIYKYAYLHAFIMANIFSEFFNHGRHNLVGVLNKSPLNICSLGGGPGTDIMGIQVALNEVYHGQSFNVSATIIDHMVLWEESFRESLLSLRASVPNSTLEKSVVPSKFMCRYIQADLHEDFQQNSVKEAIHSANVITMMKFLSALDIDNVESMLEAIFSAMRPGSYLIYIDNAGGKLHQTISNTANNCGMTTAFGPLKYLQFDTQYVLFRHKIPPCSSTTVHAHVWVKKSNRKWLLIVVVIFVILIFTGVVKFF